MSRDSPTKCSARTRPSATRWRPSATWLPRNGTAVASTAIATPAGAWTLPRHGSTKRTSETWMPRSGNRAAEQRDGQAAGRDEDDPARRIERLQTDMDRFWSGRERDAAAVNRADAQDNLRSGAGDRLTAQEDREASRDREEAQRDRSAAARERDEAADIIEALREGLRSRDS